MNPIHAETRRIPPPFAWCDGRPTFGARLWKLVVALGEHRTRHELLRLADDEVAARPGLAALLRRAAHDGWPA